MIRNHRGFTIVELLTVIVVISILAAVSITSYNGIQTRALNAARLEEMKTWSKLFTLYYSINNTYPPSLVAGQSYCLGEQFPIGYDGNRRCRDYMSVSSSSYLESDNSALMSDIKTVASLPKSDRTPIDGTVGPYMSYYGGATLFRIYGLFKGNSGECPAGLTQEYSRASLLICKIDVARP